MTGKLPDKNQRELSRPLLVELIDKRRELAYAIQQSVRDKFNINLDMEINVV